MLLSGAAQAAHPTHAAGAYYTLGGARPANVTVCGTEPVYGALGICLADSVVRARSLFGDEDSYARVHDGVASTWHIGPLELVATTRIERGLRSLSVALPAGGAARVRLNHGLVLGSSRMADVLAALGTPQGKTIVLGKQTVTYEYTYPVPCSDGCLMQFSYETARANDPDGFNATLAARPVTGFEICRLRRNGLEGQPTCA